MGHERPNPISSISAQAARTGTTLAVDNRTMEVRGHAWVGDRAVAWNPKGCLNNSLRRVAVIVRSSDRLLAGAAICPPLGRGCAGGLPPGPGHDEVAGLCDACHSQRLVVQQRLDRDSWDETLDRMIEEQGMPVLEPDERAVILDYLETYFGRAAPR